MNVQFHKVFRCIFVILFLLGLSFLAFKAINDVYSKHRVNNELIYRLNKVSMEVYPYIKNEKTIAFFSDDSSAFMYLKSNYVFAPIILKPSLNQEFVLTLNRNLSDIVTDSSIIPNCILEKEIEGFRVKLYKLKYD